MVGIKLNCIDFNVAFDETTYSVKYCYSPKIGSLFNLSWNQSQTEVILMLKAKQVTTEFWNILGGILQGDLLSLYCLY